MQKDPFYTKLDEESLFLHYSDVAKNVDLPIMLYNIPSLTGQKLTPELVYRMALKYSNIVGIKETVEDIEQIREIILKVKGERNVFQFLQAMMIIFCIHFLLVGMELFH